MALWASVGSLLSSLLFFLVAARKREHVSALSTTGTVITAVLWTVTAAFLEIGLYDLPLEQCGASVGGSICREVCCCDPCPFFFLSDVGNLPSVLNSSKLSEPSHGVWLEYISSLH